MSKSTNTITRFEQQCYQALKTVPSGRVISYQGLATMVGRPNAYRAVGNAMNKNPFAPQVPCHRVVSANGELGGFADAIRVKIERLRAEGVVVKNNKIVDFARLQFR